MNYWRLLEMKEYPIVVWIFDDAINYLNFQSSNKVKHSEEFVLAKPINSNLYELLYVKSGLNIINTISNENIFLIYIVFLPLRLGKVSVEKIM